MAAFSVGRHGLVYRPLVVSLKKKVCPCYECRSCALYTKAEQVLNKSQGLSVCRRLTVQTSVARANYILRALKYTAVDLKKKKKKKGGVGWGVGVGV